MSDDDPMPRVRVSLFRRPNFAGLVVALVFWWESLIPSMLPRSALAQSVISAVCIAVGYGIGTLLGYWIHALLRRYDKEPKLAVKRPAWIVLGVLALVIIIVGLALWPGWQNDQRALVGLDSESASRLLTMVPATVILTAILVFVGRVVWRGIRWLDRWISRRVPRAGAIIITAFLVFFIGRWFFADVAFDSFHTWANDTFSSVDDGTDDGTVQPTSDTVSGSPASLVKWEDLGRQGRNFVAEAPTTTDLESFFGAGAGVEDPIRVYVGLKAADSAEERADLAVKELDRTGAFDRKVLVVTTVTGTGWVDPDAAEAIEYLYGGDTAMVGMQYSFLPSWISTLVDGDHAKEAGSVLFDAVHKRWSELPENDRPKLLVFGQSLGSFGAEAAFAGSDARSSVAHMVAQTDGVLYTGPTNGNEIWAQITSERNSASPVWRPVFDDGVSVRFANKPEELLEPDPSWTVPRILYVQHPSDPVTFWSMDTMWSRPEWLDDPKGYDIPDRASWFPFVTWSQVVADLAAGFSAEPGHGHDYRLAFVASWAAIAPPDGWTADDTTRLEQHLRAGG